jgi:hypothetical protein
MNMPKRKEKTNKANKKPSRAQACNPSYSRGRDREDQSSKPALGEKFGRPYLKKAIIKMG